MEQRRRHVRLVVLVLLSAAAMLLADAQTTVTSGRVSTGRIAHVSKGKPVAESEWAAVFSACVPVPVRRERASAPPHNVHVNCPHGIRADSLSENGTNPLTTEMRPSPYCSSKKQQQQELVAMLGAGVSPGLEWSMERANFWTACTMMVVGEEESDDVLVTFDAHESALPRATRPRHMRPDERVDWEKVVVAHADSEAMSLLETSAAHVRIVFEDESLTAHEKDTVRDTIVLMQIMSRASSMNLLKTSTKVIYELIIRPMITLLKKLIQQAAQKFLGNTLVKLLNELLSKLIGMFTAGGAMLGDAAGALAGAANDLANKAKDAANAVNDAANAAAQAAKDAGQAAADAANAAAKAAGDAGQAALDAAKKAAEEARRIAEREANKRIEEAKAKERAVKDAIGKGEKWLALQALRPLAGKYFPEAERLVNKARHWKDVIAQLTKIFICSRDWRRGDLTVCLPSCIKSLREGVGVVPKGSGWDSIKHMFPTCASHQRPCVPSIVKIKFPDIAKKLGVYFDDCDECTKDSASFCVPYVLRGVRLPGVSQDVVPYCPQCTPMCLPPELNKDVFWGKLGGAKDVLEIPSCEADDDTKCGKRALSVCLPRHLDYVPAARESGLKTCSSRCTQLCMPDELDSSFIMGKLGAAEEFIKLKACPPANKDACGTFTGQKHAACLPHHLLLAPGAHTVKGTFKPCNHVCTAMCLPKGVDLSGKLPGLKKGGLPVCSASELKDQQKPSIGKPTPPSKGGKGPPTAPSTPTPTIPGAPRGKTQKTVEKEGLEASARNAASGKSAEGKQVKKNVKETAAQQQADKTKETKTKKTNDGQQQKQQGDGKAATRTSTNTGTADKNKSKPSSTTQSKQSQRDGKATDKNATPSKTSKQRTDGKATGKNRRGGDVSASGTPQAGDADNAGATTAKKGRRPSKGDNKEAGDRRGSQSPDEPSRGGSESATTGRRRHPGTNANEGAPDGKGGKQVEGGDGGGHDKKSSTLSGVWAQKGPAAAHNRAVEAHNIVNKDKAHPLDARDLQNDHEQRVPRDATAPTSTPTPQAEPAHQPVAPGTPRQLPVATSSSVPPPEPTTIDMSSQSHGSQPQKKKPKKKKKKKKKKNDGEGKTDGDKQWFNRATNIRQFERDAQEEVYNQDHPNNGNDEDTHTSKRRRRHHDHHNHHNHHHGDDSDDAPLKDPYADTAWVARNEDEAAWEEAAFKHISKRIYDPQDQDTADDDDTALLQEAGTGSDFVRTETFAEAATHDAMRASTWATNAEKHKEWVQHRLRNRNRAIEAALAAEREQVTAKAHHMARNGATAEEFAEFQQQMKELIGSKHRVHMITQPLIDLILPKLVSGLNQGVTDMAQLLLEKGLSLTLVQQMQSEINAAVTRDTVRKVTRTATADLTTLVLEEIKDVLLKELTVSVTGHVTQGLMSSLTYTLANSITKSMTRSPSTDYFCYFCFNQGLYCDDCKSAELQGYYTDAYVAYFARYYERYYSFYYGANSYYAQVFCNSVAKPWYWGGTTEMPEMMNPCLDSEDDTCVNVNLVPSQTALDQGAGVPDD